MGGFPAGSDTYGAKKYSVHAEDNGERLMEVQQAVRQELAAMRFQHFPCDNGGQGAECTQYHEEPGRHDEGVFTGKPGDAIE